MQAEIRGSITSPAARAVKRSNGQPLCKRQMYVQVWKTLLPVMKKMFTTGEGLSNDEYIKLYTLLFDFGVCEDRSSKCGRYSGPHTITLPSPESELYGSIQAFLVQKVKDLEPLLVTLNANNEDEIIKFYVKHAEIYFNATKMLNGICTHLNNTLVKKVNSVSGKTKYHRIEHVSYMCWKKGIFNKLGAIVTKSISQLVQRERNGDCIPSSNITAVIDSLIKIGYNEETVQEIQKSMKSPPITLMPQSEQDELLRSRLEEMELSFYRSLFEKQFLEDTATWIPYRVNQLLDEPISSKDYFDKVSQLLKEDIDRMRRYFHRTTENTVKNMWITAAISKKRDQVFAAIPENFSHYRLEIGYNLLISNFLKAMYDMCSVDIEDKSSFEKSLREQVSIEINARLQKGMEKGQTIQKDPTFFVEAFQSTYQSFQVIMQNAELVDNVYKCTLQNGMKDAMTSNIAIEKIKGEGASETAFVRRLHALLKNRKMTEQQVENECKFVMSLYGMMSNEKSFERNYRNYLTMRIVEKTSISNDLEESLILLMGTKSGLDSINHLTKLFQEGMVNCTEMMTRFKQSQFGAGLPFAFDITVLPFLHCPWTNSQETAEYNIPHEFVPTRNAFIEFFGADTKNNAKRNLQWLHSRSKGELETSGTFFKKPKKYILCCSLYQMTLILMYNSVDSRVFEEIVVQSGLSEIEANRVVSQLVKANLLIVEKKSENTGTGPNPPLDNEDVVKLNLDFYSINTKIVINSAVRIEQVKKDNDKASEDTLKTIEIMFQATIVRIMKTRKTITHNELMSEVIADSLKPGKITTRTPVPCMKRAIEELISRDFIERDKKDLNIYIYKA